MVTQHQEEVLTEGLNILKTSKRLLIKGSAGVGKTFVANELIRRIRNMIPTYGRTAICSAPTNKAVAVIKGKVTPNEDLVFVTAHSALKLKRHVNNKTGEVTYEPWFNDKYPPLKGIYLMVIDEASMLPMKIMGYIEEFATRFNVIVVFLGDDKQLNPVGELHSTVFLGKPIDWDEKGKVIKYEPYPEVELTEIVRQGEGNPIIHLSRNIPLIWKKEEMMIGDDLLRYGYTYTYIKDKIISRLAEINGTDEMKYLAYTNADVDNVNVLVRNLIYGKPAKVEVGETIIFNAPYGEDYFNNEELYVETIEVIEKKIGVPVKNNVVTGEFEVQLTDFKLYIVNGDIQIIHEDFDFQFEKIKKFVYLKCKSRAVDWKTYYTFVESFADIKYNHALTIHKSQGSTFKNTIINIKSVAINQKQSERERLLYTGITRASDLLILYNV